MEVKMAQAKSLSDSEIRRVLAVVSQGRNSERNRIMVLLTFYAGLRVGEVAALKWKNVLNPDGTITNEIRLKPEQTKGKHSRTIMVSDRLRKELSIYADSRVRKEPEKPVIYSQRSREGFNSNTLSQEFKTLYQKAGLNGATSHSGRRTFITTLANKGVGVRVLMALAGHRNITTTQLYIDINDEMKRIAVNLI
jgi:integrase/recombinase XerD